MMCVAMLSGASSQLAIADWGRNYGSEWTQKLGFSRDDTPSQPTISRILRVIDIAQFERVLSEWGEAAMRAFGQKGDDEDLLATEREMVAIDGKALRIAAKQGSQYTHLLSACSQRLGIVLGQLNVEKKTNEIGVMNEFLAGLVLEGRVFTMDALLTQKFIASAIVEGGGDYIQVVKNNQPTLLYQVKQAFDQRRRNTSVEEPNRCAQ